MTFDVIITTYNRPSQVVDLVRQINLCQDPVPKTIIIVDASEKDNHQLEEFKKLIHLHSCHKNQPYQRALGCSVSTSDVVIFMDDDLIIINNRIFEKLLTALEDENTIGSSGGLIISGNTKDQFDRKIINRGNPFIDLFWSFTGAIRAKKGTISLAGLIGERNESTPYVEHFSGGIMAFKREFFPKLYDKRLFDFNELKLGKGEDKYLSIGALKFGKLRYLSEIFLDHPSGESYYYINLFSFSKRELLSRLLLSYRVAEIKKIPEIIVLLHFYWYAIWRIIISLGYFLFHIKRKNWQIFIGRVVGLLGTFRYKIRNKDGFSEINWEEEMVLDIRNYEQSKS